MNESVGRKREKGFVDVSLVCMPVLGYVVVGPLYTLSGCFESDVVHLVGLHVTTI